MRSSRIVVTDSTTVLGLLLSLSSRRGVVRHCALLAVAAVTLSCDEPITQVHIDGDTRIQPGARLTHRDDPIYRAKRHLEQGDLTEEAISKGSTWAYLNCDVHSSLPGGDPATGSVPDTSLVEQPTQLGDFVAGTNTDSVPWEAKSVRLGYTAMSLNADKERADHTKPMAALGVDAALAPDTMPVPIQLARLMPKSESSPYRDYMVQLASQERASRLFDYMPKIERQGVSHPGGLLSSSQYQEFSESCIWTPPDEVWDQCSIQWRMISFMEDVVEADAQLAPDECSSLKLDALVDGSYYDLVTKTLVDTNLPVLIISVQVSKSGCVVEGLGQGPTSPVAVVGVNDKGLTTPAHELGHVLGLSHPCSGGSGLMCEQALTTTLDESTCASARRSAATIVKMHWGVSVAP